MLRQFPLYAISEIWFWKIFGPGEGPGWVFILQIIFFRLINNLAALGIYIALWETS